MPTAKREPQLRAANGRFAPRAANGGSAARETRSIAEATTLARDKGVLQVRRQRRGSWDEETRETFLATLAATANVLKSCRAVSMTPPGAYQLRKRDPVFRAGWSAALREAYQQLELTLLDRSINGHERPVFYGGAIVGKIQHYSDGLAIKMLAHHRLIGGSGERIAPSAEALAEAQARVLARFDADRLTRMRDAAPGGSD